MLIKFIFLGIKISVEQDLERFLSFLEIKAITFVKIVNLVIKKENKD